MNNEEIYQAVSHKYGEVALNPDKKHGFPVGFDFARSVGYPEELLNRLPKGGCQIICRTFDTCSFCRVERR